MRTFIPFVVLLSASVAVPATIHVPGDQPTIQAGIDAAAAGDTVLVAPGIYPETDLVLKSDIHVLGDVTGTDAVIVDAELSGGFFTATDVSGTALGGIEFTNASSYLGEHAAKIIRSSLAFDACVLSEIRHTGYGFGGCLVENSSPTFEDCEFVDNRARVFDISGGSAVFRECSFVGGYALEWHKVPVATVVNGSSVEFEDCTFRENRLYGGFPHALAGVFASFGSSVECRSCLFVENDGHRGCGVAYVSGGSLLFEDCKLTDNSGAFGRLIQVFGPATMICTNSSFARNGSYGSREGAISLGSNVSATIDLCQFTYHSAVIEVGGHAASLALTRSLLWDNDGPVVLVNSGAAEVSQCTFMGGGTFLERAPRRSRPQACTPRSCPTA